MTKKACGALRKILAMSVLFAMAGTGLAETPPTGEPITIGTAFTVETQDAERKVNVVPPAGYAESDAQYPLVIVLDGGLSQDFFLALGMERWNQLWQRSQPAIFVGLETVDRQRELLPPTNDDAERERYPSAGNSAAFRNWLADDILPMLRERYRTDGRAFLIGESAAGHFVVETWVERPELFDGYAALSPSLQWDGEALSRHFASMDQTDRPPLYLSLADEGGATEEGILRLAANSDACLADRRETLVHATTLHGLFPEALQFLLPTEADWLAEYGLTVDCAVRPDPSG